MTNSEAAQASLPDLEPTSFTSVRDEVIRMLLSDGSTVWTVLLRAIDRLRSLVAAVRESIASMREQLQTTENGKRTTPNYKKLASAKAHANLITGESGTKARERRANLAAEDLGVFASSLGAKVAGALVADSAEAATEVEVALGELTRNWATVIADAAVLPTILDQYSALGEAAAPGLAAHVGVLLSEVEAGVKSGSGRKDATMKTLAAASVLRRAARDPLSALWEGTLTPTGSAVRPEVTGSKSAPFLFAAGSTITLVADGVSDTWSVPASTPSTMKTAVLDTSRSFTTSSTAAVTSLAGSYDLRRGVITSGVVVGSVLIASSGLPAGAAVGDVVWIASARRVIGVGTDFLVLDSTPTAGAVTNVTVIKDNRLNVSVDGGNVQTVGYTLADPGVFTYSSVSAATLIGLLAVSGATLSVSSLAVRITSNVSGASSHIGVLPGGLATSLGWASGATADGTDANNVFQITTHAGAQTVTFSAGAVSASAVSSSLALAGFTSSVVSGAVQFSTSLLGYGSMLEVDNGSANEVLGLSDGYRTRGAGVSMVALQQSAVGKPFSVFGQYSRLGDVTATAAGTSALTMAKPTGLRVSDMLELLVGSERLTFGVASITATGVTVDRAVAAGTYAGFAYRNVLTVRSLSTDYGAETTITGGTARTVAGLSLGGMRPGTRQLTGESISRIRAKDVVTIGSAEWSVVEVAGNVLTVDEESYGGEAEATALGASKWVALVSALDSWVPISVNTKFLEAVRRGVTGSAGRAVASAKLDELVVSLDELEDAFDVYDAAVVDEVDRAISAVRTSGADKAADLLCAAKLEEFAACQAETSNYAGDLNDATNAASDALPVSLIDLDEDVFREPEGNDYQEPDPDDDSDILTFEDDPDTLVF